MDTPKTYVSACDGGGFCLIHQGQPLTKEGLDLEECDRVAKQYKLTATSVYHGNLGIFKAR